MLDEEIEEGGYDPIAIARRNPQSKAAAIKAFCATCIGFPDPGWRSHIRGCTAPGCPLFPHRPYKLAAE